MTASHLRLALAADAVASGATGLLLIAGAGLVASFTDLPERLLFGIGVFFVPFVAFLVWTATRPAIPRLAALAIVELNLIWVIASFGLLASGMVAPNGLGIAFVAAQAVAVLVLAILQWTALRQPGVRAVA